MEKKEVSSNSSLKTLYPFIDQEGLLRVGRQLQQCTLPYQAIHQMILPPHHHFTKLVVSAEHIRLHHAGPQLPTASLCEKYSIPRIRNLVKSVIHQCKSCYKFKAQATQQLMGELPPPRVQLSRPFLTTGVDYTGPISLRLWTTHSKTITKGYIAIFVCFVTRAVHIEVVTSLTTEAFLAALWRSIARREKPRTMYSDNGTNFQGASNELHEIYNMFHSSSDGKDTGLLDQQGMWLEIHPTSCTALRRIMGSSCQIHEVPSATNIRFSHCHIWGTLHINSPR